MLRFVLAAAVPLALAQPATANVKEAILERMDVNQDGFVDDVELMRRLIFVFSRMDQNRDRMVTRQEYADWPRLAAANGEPVVTRSDQQRDRRFAHLDADKDGRLTFEEYKAPALIQLEQADRARRAQLGAR
jgi:hypothetical protein